MVTLALDIESVYASELLEAVLESAERVGIRVVWGAIHGDSLTVHLDDELPEAIFAQVFEAKLKSKQHPVFSEG